MMAKGLLQAGAKVYITSRTPADCDAKVEELSIYEDCKGIVAMWRPLQTHNNLRQRPLYATSKEDRQIDS